MSDTINSLLNNIFDGKGDKTYLRQHFETRLDEIGLSFNQFLESYEMNFRTTNAILDGSFKNIDFLSLLKLSDFLSITSDEILKECISYMPPSTQTQVDQSKKRTYILDHFNLNALKKDGVISSIKDFGHIEKSLLRCFGLKDIYEYDALNNEVGLFSTTKASLKDARPKRAFKNKAIKICKNIINDNAYNEVDLKDFFRRIRSYSTDIDTGLLKVIRKLYKLGITVVILPSFTSTGARGLTIQSNGKPAIILTDHGKKYSTLWFALVHELYHVIFDWKDISSGRVHVSDEDDFENDKELQANSFARDYMFPRFRMDEIRPNIHDPIIVKSFAIESDVHDSIIYDNYCYDNPDKYPVFSRFIRVPWTRLRSAIMGSFSHSNSPEEFAKYYQTKIYSELK